LFDRRENSASCRFILDVSKGDLVLLGFLRRPSKRVLAKNAEAEHAFADMVKANIRDYFHKVKAFFVSLADFPGFFGPGAPLRGYPGPVRMAQASVRPAIRLSLRHDLC
jgi:hypothetical protein